MNEINEIKKLRDLIKIRDLFKRVSRISYNINQFEKRYPEMDSMTSSEMDELIKFYLALGFDFEDLNKDWKKIYKEYKNDNKS